MFSATPFISMSFVKFEFRCAAVKVRKLIQWNSESLKLKLYDASSVQSRSQSACCVKIVCGCCASADQNLSHLFMLQKIVSFLIIQKLQ